jgi:hypothetical protein
MGHLRMRTLCAVLLCAFRIYALPARAATALSITGTVVDAQSGVAVAGAAVHLAGSRRSAVTNARGTFRIADLPNGTYRLEIARAGYQPALSTPVTLDGRDITTTLSIVRASNGLGVIAVTSTRASGALQQSSTQSRTLDTESLVATGTVRAGDALRTLPGVNNGINGDTAALADDINLNVRGIGQAETVAAIDGHPIGYGIKGGYNYQLSPIFPFRDIQVLYGSGGSNALGVNAIGGVVNFQTLDATAQQRLTATQGFGSFERLSSDASATGTAGKLGYALAYGAAGVDGPFRNATFYQPAARASYVDDSAATSHADLLKLTYTFDPRASLTFTDVNSSYWENKTGNGDGDYLPYAVAFARGGATYAAANAGWQGAGPAWQSFNFGYQDLDLRRRAGSGTISLDTFTTLYNDDQYRANLPYKSVYGDTEKTSFSQVDSSGAMLSDEFAGTFNDLTFGYSYRNDAYVYRTIRFTSTTATFPDTDERSWFLRDVYQVPHTMVTAFTNLWARHASATDSSYLDPRLSLLDRVTPRDIVRVAYGATTTQPTSDELGQPFVPSALADGTLQGAGGGTSYVCGGLNAIGSAPSSVLRPERGVDTEASYGHTWFGDTMTQLELYNVNVYDKLYSTIVPLTRTGTAFVSPAQIAAADAALTTACGPGNYQLGVSGAVNVGTLQARGADLSGRWRFTQRVYLDYDWALTSSRLVDAPAALLQSNLTDIVGSQIKGVPLHTANVALDATIGALDTRYTLYTVSANNTKNLPAYSYSDVQVGIPYGPGRFTIAVSNLFDQNAHIAGYIGEGVPAALNGYATAGAYTPLIGTAATEQYGLPYRALYINYQLRR